MCPKEFLDFTDGAASEDIRDMRDYNVVLVDDDVDFLEVIKMSLRDEFKVSTFTDAKKAIQHLAINPFDALVMDFHMPGHDSFKVLIFLSFRFHSKNHFKQIASHFHLTQLNL